MMPRRQALLRVLAYAGVLGLAIGGVYYATHTNMSPVMAAAAGSVAAAPGASGGRPV